MSDGLTLEQLCDAKGLRPTDLAAFDVEAWTHNGKPCVRIPYTRADGTPAPVKLRLRLEEPGRFSWPRGKATMPYGLDRLASAPADSPIIIPEGETDCWTLWHSGFAALGIPGAKNWKPEYARLLAEKNVYAWQEPGTAGAEFVAAITRDIPSARIIRACQFKDPNALWLADRDNFQAAMRALIASARSQPEEAAASHAAEVEAALAAGREVLEHPHILDLVTDYLLASGYAGDTKAPLTVYLALTSRFLRRPMNLAIIAPSAAGKSHAVDVVLPLVPPSGYAVVKAASARALVYSADDFEHRTVIVSEADSIPADGPAASAVRALAADNVMTYDVTERDPRTNQWGVRHIVKPGPTGLITTSTRPLHDQMWTRVLSIGISDTTEQTRAVLYAHASAVSGDAPSLDTAPFIAAQQWLASAGIREISIPFARVLAGAVPADLVRMRRDFRQLLTAIEASAFLHQRQRERDLQGRVVASLDDYATARALLLDVFTASATGGVTDAIREVVAVVQRLYPTAPDGLTCATVADHLTPKLHRNTAWYRIRTALRLGLLINAETRKGHPAKLKPGEPLPDEREALPTIERLASLIGSSLPESNSTFESRARNLAGHAATAIQAEGLAVLETPVEPASDPSGLDGGPASQRFNSSDEGRATGDEQPTARSYSVHPEDTDDPMYRAVLDVFGRHAETPMA